MDATFNAYTQALANYAKPQAFVDMDAFDANLAALLKRAQGMPIRVASKSVRCPDLLRYALEFSEQFQGLLCFHGLEAVVLAQQGFTDLLVAYPTTDAHVLNTVCQQIARGGDITLMVDSPQQAAIIADIARNNNVVVPLCMDVDMSMHLPKLNFGVYRSPVRTVETALALYQTIAVNTHVRLTGVMGYEAQVAGVPDKVPGQGAKNHLIHYLKQRSIKQLHQRRQAIVTALKDAGAELTLVNGGGTGSLESTIQDTSVTEVAAGSGLYSPTLFDNYRAFKHQAALLFVLEVCRQPSPEVVTCLGGGYVASGAAGKDKLPVPVWPQGLKLIDNEGAGEVQTPLTGEQLPPVGEQVFFRHAKAGELLERFNQVLLVRGNKCVGNAQTYRGLGWQFI